MLSSSSFMARLAVFVVICGALSRCFEKGYVNTFFVTFQKLYFVQQLIVKSF